MKHRNLIVLGGAFVLVLLGVLMVAGIVWPGPRGYTYSAAVIGEDTIAAVAAMQDAGFTEEQIRALNSLLDALGYASSAQTNMDLMNLEERMRTHVANSHLDNNRWFTGIGVAFLGLMVAFFGRSPRSA